MGVTILSPSLAFRRNHVSLNSRWRTYPVRQTCTKEELVFSLRGGGAAGSPPALVAAARDGAAQIDAAAAHVPLLLPMALPRALPMAPLLPLPPLLTVREASCTRLMSGRASSPMTRQGASAMSTTR